MRRAARSHGVLDPPERAARHPSERRIVSDQKPGGIAPLISKVRCDARTATPLRTGLTSSPYDSHSQGRFKNGSQSEGEECS